MTRPDFNGIELGTDIKEVVEQCGAPYRIQKKNDGSQEYEYVERVMMGEQVIQENRYFLTVKDGKVISKERVEKRPPAYNEIYDEDPNDVSN